MERSYVGERLHRPRVDTLANDNTPCTRLIEIDKSVTLPAVITALPAFNITRLRSCGEFENSVTKVPAVPALLVSVPLAPIECQRYRLWAEDTVVQTTAVVPYQATVIDVAAHPGCWTDGVFDFVHYHIPRILLDDVAEGLGFIGADRYRQAVFEEDLVLAQLTRNVIPFIGKTDDRSLLALEQLGLVLSAHVVQRYGIARSSNREARGGLAPWQSRRATEMMKSRLDGSLLVSEVARECSLSASQFSRAFKSTFKVTPHQWLLEERINHAKQLLAHSTLPLGDISLTVGFNDQPAFSRAFRRAVGTTPGQWRRMSV